MKEVYLKQINLENYRNLSDLTLEFSKNINIIVGANGAGKTNILESISLLSPGKGLKSANFDQICKSGTDFWRTNCYLQSKLGNAQIISVFSSQSQSRQITYNGSRITSNELINLLNPVWLTPQMEGLFLASPANRRKFLDRIIYNFDNKHAKILTKYDYFMRERNKILSEGNFLSNESWLAKIEEKMSIEANSIEKARQDAVILMQEAINCLNTPFVKAKLKITELLNKTFKSESFIEEYKSILASNRRKDSYSGRTNFGVHKTDLLVFHQGNQRESRLCSTGEQKALIISLILASVEFILHNTQTKPILLLDELFIHLDSKVANHLMEYIITTKLQTFITSTDMIGLEKLSKIAYIIDL